MRIALINERWTAGATRCARDLQRGLEARHTVRYYPNERSLSAGDQLAALAEFQPDVVHLHSFYGDLPYPTLAAVARTYPTVFTPHDPRPIGDTALACWNCTAYRTCFQCPLIGAPKRYSLLRHTYFWSRLRKRRVHARLPARTTVVCVSDWMKERVLQTELARLRVERIHNGVDLERFRRHPDARRELGLPEDVPILLFAAHHAGWKADERKGGHLLAQALHEVVLPRFPQLLVLAVGGGMIPNLPNVRPMGFIPPEEMARYYSAATVFVAPSLADNLPYTVLEAMGCEVPVVASDVGGIPEEIEEGRTGRLFRNGSAAALGAALLALLEDPAGTAAMGRAGRARAELLFSLSAFVRSYEDLYASLAHAPA
jgi:glycosyltransferase involved in cell wall biosynthesis